MLVYKGGLTSVSDDGLDGPTLPSFFSQTCDSGFSVDDVLVSMELEYGDYHLLYSFSLFLSSE